MYDHVNKNDTALFLNIYIQLTLLITIAWKFNIFLDIRYKLRELVLHSLIIFYHAQETI